MSARLIDKRKCILYARQRLIDEGGNVYTWQSSKDRGVCVGWVGVCVWGRGWGWVGGDLQQIGEMVHRREGMWMLSAQSGFSTGDHSIIHSLGLGDVRGTHFTQYAR